MPFPNAVKNPTMELETHSLLARTTRVDSITMLKAIALTQKEAWRILA